MTAAHLVLVWQERDDPNLLRHAGRAKEVGRNPRVVTYEPGFGPERVVLRVGGGRPACARHPRQDVIERHFGESVPLSLGVEEEVMILDAATFEPIGAVHVLVRGGMSTSTCGNAEDGAARVRR